MKSLVSGVIIDKSVSRIMRGEATLRINKGWLQPLLGDDFADILPSVVAGNHGRTQLVVVSERLQRKTAVSVCDFSPFRRGTDRQPGSEVYIIPWR